MPVLATAEHGIHDEIAVGVRSIGRTGIVNLHNTFFDIGKRDEIIPVARHASCATVDIATVGECSQIILLVSANMSTGDGDFGFTCRHIIAILIFD